MCNSEIPFKPGEAIAGIQRHYERVFRYLATGDWSKLGQINETIQADVDTIVNLLRSQQNWLEHNYDRLRRLEWEPEHPLRVEAWLLHELERVTAEKNRAVGEAGNKQTEIERLKDRICALENPDSVPTSGRAVNVLENFVTVCDGVRKDITGDDPDFVMERVSTWPVGEE
jgi:hypothetical protein